MKKAIAMKWVKALRSGAYKQGRRRLYDTNDNTYCCLGVLRAIDKDTISEDADSLLLNGDTKRLGMVVGADNCTNATLIGDNGITPVSSQSQLAYLNDQGVSFTDIADLIEVCWEEL